MMENLESPKRKTGFTKIIISSLLVLVIFKTEKSNAQYTLRDTGIKMWDAAIVRIEGLLNPTLDVYSKSNWHPRMRLATNNGADIWSFEAAGSNTGRNLFLKYNETTMLDIHKNGNIHLKEDANLYGLGILQGFNDLRFQATPSSGTNLFIKGNGNIGIGTNTPNKRLTVKIDNTIPYDGFSLMNQRNKQIGVIAQDAGSLNGYFRVNDGNGGSGVFLIADPQKSSYINSRLGIGTDAPNMRLTVKIDSTVSYDGISLMNQRNKQIGVIAQDVGSLNGYFRVNDGNGGNGVFLIADPQKSSYINSKLGIGTLNPAEKLDVNGKIKADGVILTIGSFPDYVFEPGYELMPLAELEQYIRDNRHLPNIPSEKEVIANGADLGLINARLVEKIEELTLYTINQDKEIQRLKNELVMLKKLIQGITR